MSGDLAGLAASAALAVSDIPFNGPISEVRVAKIDGKLVINPTPAQLEKASLEFIVAGSEEYILMVEGEADEISEDEMVEALQFAHEEIKKHCKIQKELTIAVGKEKKREENCQKYNNAPICKHCGKKHPTKAEDDCWELEKNKDSRPSNWKSAKST